MTRSRLVAACLGLALVTGACGGSSTSPSGSRLALSSIAPNTGSTFGGTTVTITGSNVSFTLTGIIVAANGDEIFTTATGTGTLTATGTESTLVSTITGGTGRFPDASGTITSTITSVNVSLVGTTLTSNDTETHTGRISY